LDDKNKLIYEISNLIVQSNLLHQAEMELREIFRENNLVKKSANNDQLIKNYEMKIELRNKEINNSQNLDKSFDKKE
jgi:hypothetical protein